MEIKSFNPAQNLKVGHRKENALDKAYLVFTANPDDAGKEINPEIELRLYRTANRAYACLWVYSGNKATGSGQAGGGGYDKASAAAEAAIYSAGFKLSQQIGGVGEGAIKRALWAIAGHLKMENAYMVVAHG